MKYEIVDPPIIKTMNSPGLALLYDALEELPEGKAARFKPEVLTTCKTKNDIIAQGPRP